MSRRSSSRVTALVLVAALVAACGESTTGTDSTVEGGETTPADPQGCADVIEVVVTPDDSGTYRFDVTVQSADTGWEKYADLWEVRAPDGTVLGQRILAHPHVEEQPFTRSQSGIGVPEGVPSVKVVARDSAAGFCGEAFDVEIP